MYAIREGQRRLSKDYKFGKFKDRFILSKKEFSKSLMWWISALILSRGICDWVYGYTTSWRAFSPTSLAFSTAVTVNVAAENINGT